MGAAWGQDPGLWMHTAQELFCESGLAVGFGGFLLCLQLTEGLTAWSDSLVLCSGQLAEPNGDKGDVKFF